MALVTMKLRSRKTLIFDIDGTLVNSGIDWDKIRELVKRTTGIDVDGKPLAEVLSSLPEREGKLLERVVADAEASSLANVVADEELRGLIMRAKSLGYAVAVVSLRNRVTASEVLDRLGIRDLIDALVTRDETPRRDEQLSIVLDVLGGEPRHTTFFGDTPWDAEAARELGLQFIRIARDGRIGRPPENLLRRLREVLGEWR